MSRKKKDDHVAGQKPQEDEDPSGEFGVEGGVEPLETLADEIPEVETAAEMPDEDMSDAGKIEALEKENEALNDRLLRASAEFENYKKRLDRQWTDFKKYAHESLVKELLTIVDNLERAVVAADDEEASITGLVEGVEMTLQEILRVFERFKVAPIKAVGEIFDPNFHQAVSKQESDEAEDNTVIEEYQRGYLIHDRLLRPSMVVVASASQKKAVEEAGDKEE